MVGPRCVAERILPLLPRREIYLLLFPGLIPYNFTGFVRFDSLRAPVHVVATIVTMQKIDGETESAETKKKETAACEARRWGRVSAPYQ